MNKLGCKLLWEVRSCWKAPAWSKLPLYLEQQAANLVLGAALGAQGWTPGACPCLSQKNSFLPVFYMVVP